jgi:ATP-dependent helicase/DNAse subunit B
LPEDQDIDRVCQVRILTGPPRTGKRAAMLEIALPLLRENRGRELLILVPSNPKAREIREALLAEESVGGFVGLRVLTFLDLTREVFEASDLPGRLSSPRARRWMIQRLLETLPLDALRTVRATRGLEELAADFIRSVKEAGISPAQFRKIACAPEGAPGLADLGALYDAYETERAAKDLLDREDLFAHAARALAQEQGGAFSQLRQVLVTGFYDFTPVQLALLAALSAVQHMEALTLTLLHQEGRSPGPRFTQRSLARIRSYFPKAEVKSLEGAAEPSGPPLVHLTRTFLADTEAVRSVPGDRAIEILHTPGSYREVEEIARTIRFLKHEEACTFKDVAVVFRNLSDSREKVREVFRAYQIPHRMAAGLPLRSNPLVQAVLGILEVPRSRYQRDAVCRLLRSDYLRFAPLEKSGISAERFDALAREALIHQGEAAWQKRLADRAANLTVRLQYLQEGFVESEDSDLLQQRIDACRKTIDDYASSAAIMEALIAALGAVPRQAPVGNFVEVLHRLIRAFGVEGRIYTAREPRLIRRDQRALKAFEELLAEMAENHRVLDAGRKLTMAQFIRILHQTLTDAPYTPDAPGEDAVFVTDALGMRDLHAPVVFVGGLVEGVFPRIHTPNPVFGDVVRSRLNRALGPKRWVSLSSHWREEEELLFLLAAGSAGKRLYLTYPRSDAQGRDLLPSRYVERVQSLFTDGTLSVRAVSLRDPLPAREQIFLKKELLEVTFRSLYRTARETPEAPRLLDHLLDHQKEKLAALLHGLQVIQARRGAPGNAYTGLLGPEAAARIRSREAPYSASALERYGACPFQYFCERELKVQPLEPVEDEINVMDMGSLYHQILEQFYRKLQGPVTRENFDEATAHMDAIVDRLLSRQAFKGVPGHQKLWEIRQGEIREILNRFLECERVAFEETGEVPSHFEAAFGMPPLPSGDPLSSPEPFTVPSETGPIRFMGKVDRIDLKREVGRPVFSIVDYKTGRHAPPASAVERGESLQLPLYAAWVRKVLPGTPEMHQGAFYLLRSGEKKRQIPAKKDESWEALWENTQQHIQTYVESIRRGEFPVGEKKCAEYCRYAGVCRIDEE